MADVLDSLELLSSVLDKHLEAMRVLETVLVVDELVDSTCDTLTLVGW